LPPLKRPYLDLPRQLGFTGSDFEVIKAVSAQMPQLLPQIYSASNMWVANAATVSPSADAPDGRVHFTAANLVTHLHRAVEAQETAANLQKIFADEAHFAHHAPLPPFAAFGDEGAANIMRFTAEHGQPGLEVLVYGTKTHTYPARQTAMASASIFHRHGISRYQLVEQKAAAIDAGVFHNDVIAVANENVLLYHEHAFEEGENAVNAMEAAFGLPIIRCRIAAESVSLLQAVKSYLFNSQLVSVPGGAMVLIAPTESQNEPAVAQAIEALIAAGDNPIAAVHYLDLRESMKNGGGPACLRLRVVLTGKEQAAIHQGVLFNDRLYQQLGTAIESHYRDELSPDDLADPALINESFAAHTAIMQALGL